MVTVVIVVIVVALAALYFVGKGDQRLSQRELDQLRAAHPADYRRFKMSVDYRDFERNGRVDYTKIVRRFKAFLAAPRS